MEQRDPLRAEGRAGVLCDLISGICASGCPQQLIYNNVSHIHMARGVAWYGDLEHDGMAFIRWAITKLRSTIDVQGSAKRWALGCVNSTPAARGSQDSRNLGPTF